MRLIITYSLIILNLRICLCSSFELSIKNIDKTIPGASKQNWGVDCDSNGYIYFANNNGLLEFNGNIWKLYTLPDRLTVRSVKVDDKKGIIYTGAYHEFGFWERLNNGQLSYTSLSKKARGNIFHNDEIWRIILNDNKVYFQSFSNIYVYENDSIKVISPQANMVFLIKVEDKIFVQLDGLGIGILNNDKIDLIPGSELLANGIVRAIMPYGKDQYLIGSGTMGLYVYDGTNFKEWNSPVQDQIKNAQINTGLFDGIYYYVGTIMNGVHVFDKSGNLIVNFSTQNHLQNNTVLGISQDNENNIWLALDRGIDIINNHNSYYIINSDKNILGSIYSAALYNNSLYLATNRGVYYHPDFSNDLIPLKLENFIEVKGIQGQTWCLNVYDNQLLCGHNDGSYLISDNIADKISHISGGYNFKPMIVSQQKYLIQSTYYHLVMYENINNNWQVKNIFYQVREPITNIEVGAERYIWASHYLKGVYRMHLSEDLSKIESINFYSVNKGFTSNYYNRVTKIADRIAFTTTDGILTYDDLNDTIIPFARIKNETGELYFSEKIVPIGNDKYWFIKGNVTALFKVNQDTITLIQKHDFMNSDVALVEQYENIVPLNDGLSLICLENGFCITNNQKPVTKIENSEIIIANINYILDDQGDLLLPVNKQNTKLVYGKNELEFNLTVSNQFNKDIQYQYKLDGYENEWSDYTYSPVIKYYQLPWGKYTFKVKALINNTIQLPEKSYFFIIKTPWYYSVVAVLFYILLGIFIIVYSLVRIQRYYKRKEQLDIQRYEAECEQKQNEERLKSQQEIIKLKNENLKKELSYKSKELAISTMSIIKKNEILMNIKDEINKQKEELGTRYPQKFYNSLVKIIDTNISGSEEWEVFENNFNHAHNNLFIRLKEKFTDLTPSDLRLCAFLRLNLTSKEIAPLLGISVRGVETHRYRLRKRLNLSNDDNLIEFILKY